jgi:hypothetical protein
MEVAKSSACILLKINHFADDILPRTGLNLTALVLIPAEFADESPSGLFVFGELAAILHSS